jgi:hypothetical protein
VRTLTASEFTVWKFEVMRLLTVSTQAAISSASLRPATERGSGGVEAGPTEAELTTVLILGERAGSERGGVEPIPAVRTLTKEPQLKLPGSAGGVTVGIRCSTWALAASGLLAAGSLTPLEC